MITAEFVTSILAFCQNKNARILNLKDIGYDIDEHLIKIPVTESLIGLFMQCGDDLNHALIRRNEQKFEVSGFYSTRHNTLFISSEYLKYKMQYHGVFDDSLSFPYQEMQKKFCDVMTKACWPIHFDPVIMPEPKDLPWYAKLAFFNDVKAELGMKEIEEAMHCEYSALDNYDIEAFLDDPDAWAAKKADTMLQQKDGQEKLFDILEKRVIGAKMAELISADPNHPWCRIKRLQDAVTDKKTVTVIATRGENTYTFKIAASALLSQDGRYYVFSAKEPKEVREELDRTFDVLTINDIEAVLYRGKAIYKR